MAAENQKKTIDRARYGSRERPSGAVVEKVAKNTVTSPNDSGLNESKEIGQKR